MKMKMKLMYAVVLALVTFAFVGCSKDDDNTMPSENKGALKVTVTTSSSFTVDGGDVSVSCGSAGSDAKPQTWTVNGTAGTTGQVLYSVEKEYFQGGKTAILESPANYLTASVNISAFTIKQPFTLTYKVEQGGKVIVEKSQEIKSGVTPVSVSLSY
ncbi:MULTISPECIES: hypothetical protein [unclassified Sphingobacterium]|uniref:hypothetical protein n=2 Tax=unclassified Sphingobacterium TaxID=2609468 RepID=UPI001AE388C5|nr:MULTISPECIES: hypothetical protein [unclassified Sphingobacterium]MDR6737634.1 hypothetical protein [Sphingobacterium sp. 2149]